MNITITIDTSNAAFEDDPGAEVARILKRLAYDLNLLLPTDEASISLRDGNGNTVGKCEIEGDDETDEIVLGILATSNDEPDTETADEWRNAP